MIPAPASSGELVPPGSPKTVAVHLKEPNRTRETAGIELTSGAGGRRAIGDWRSRIGDQPRKNCAPAANRAAGESCGRTSCSARGEEAAATAAGASWVGMGSLEAASLLASSCVRLGLGFLCFFFSSSKLFSPGR
jgi:hypothetical protein